MSELSDIYKAVSTLFHLLAFKGPPPEDSIKPVPLDFSEYSDYTILREGIAND